MSACHLEARLVGAVSALEIDVTLPRFSSTLLLAGPSGAGKSTILRMLVGAHPARRGRLVLGERVLFDAEARVELPPEARALGYVPQGSGLFPHLSAFENVAFGLRARHPGLSRVALRERAEGALEEAGALALAGRDARALSGGERQRVALARALAVDPRALLLDEPFASLDRAGRRALRAQLARTLEAREIPCLIVTHDPSDVEALGGELVFVEAGRVVYQGPFRGLGAATSETARGFLDLDA